MFSAYGEGVFLGIQNFLLAIMAITWTYSHIKAVLFSCAYIACVAVLLSPTLPLSILILFQTVNLPIMLSSKVVSYLIIGHIHFPIMNFRFFSFYLNTWTLVQGGT